MTNENGCLHLAILFMFVTLAVGSSILVSDSEGFPTAAGSKLRLLSDAQKNNFSNPTEKNNKGVNSGLEKSQKKTGEGSGVANNDTKVLTSPKSENNTVGVATKDGHNNSSAPENLTKDSKPEKVKHEGSQSSDGDTTGNEAATKKQKSKTSKDDDLDTKKKENGSNPDPNLAPPKQDSPPSNQSQVSPKQNSVSPVDTKGSKDQTQSNDTVTYPPPQKDIEPPPGESNSENPTNTGTEGDTEKSGAKSSKDATNRDSRNGQECDEAHSCTDIPNNVVACIRALGNEMQVLSLLIENKGEETLQLHINASPFLKIETFNSTFGKQEHKSVQVSMVNPVPRNVSSSKIVINSGDGECILDVPNEYANHSYKQKFFDGFSYSAIVTPMFGVYLLLFTVLAIGGSWICCKLRGKRRHGDGIRYQELEMNHPESNLSTNGGKLEAESMDGWDEWDDTWEDTEAGRSSTRPIQTVSSNGLASRRSNKDGWDNSWDD